MRKLAACILFLPTLFLPACGGDSEPSPPVIRDVAVSWQANREAGINSPGGGYQVLVDGQVVKDVPYVSGPLAPTTTTIALMPGTHTITVRAYARLDSLGGATGSLSAPSLAHTVLVL